jgi:hypothetical protein
MELNLEVKQKPIHPWSSHFQQVYQDHLTGKEQAI